MMLRKIALGSVVMVACVGATMATIPVTAAGGVSSNAAAQPTIVDPVLPTNLITSAGTLSAVGGSFANTLSYTEPAAITATVDATGTSYKAEMSDSTCMTTDPCGWWGGNSPTSRANTENAYTPVDVKDTEGVTWTWRSPLCPTFPTRATPVIDCPNIGTVTITFSQAVSNAVLHIQNLGGNSTFTGFDMTLFSRWTLTSGQKMKLISGGDTTNITVDGNMIRNKNTPQDLEAKVAPGTAPFADYANGTGSGSIQVLGNYTQITFDISLRWALVNDTGSGTPVTANTPEGVSLQVSLYKQAPPTASPASVSLPVGGRISFDALSTLVAKAPVNGGDLVPKSACIVDPATNTCGTTVTIPGEGTYTLDVNSGVVTYQSLATATVGLKTPVKFRMFDNMGQMAESTLTPEVKADGAVPKVVEQKTTTTPGTSVLLTPTLKGSPTTGSSFSSPSLRVWDGTAWATSATTTAGTWVVEGDKVRFTPATGFKGTATVPYRISDGTDQSAESDLTVTVADADSTTPETPEQTGTLPKTGFPGSLVALCGAALVLMGAGARRIRSRVS